MLNRGGLIQFSNDVSSEDWQDAQNPDPSSGIGLLDLAYRTVDEVWVSGGSELCVLQCSHGKRPKRPTWRIMRVLRSCLRTREDCFRAPNLGL